MSDPPKVHDADAMLRHRQQQTAEHVEVVADSDPFASLVTVELNVIDACNRKCVFCPHGDPDSYPNRPLWRMDYDTLTSLLRSLQAAGYRGRISLSGYGEPLLHPLIAEFVGWIVDYLERSTVEMNTNGDALRAETLRALFDSGLTYLYINCYDGPHQLAKFSRMCESVGLAPEQYRLRSRWRSGDGYSLIGNNRGGALNDPMTGHVPLAAPLQQPCWYPGYKMFVDWDGNVLGCSNDWRRTSPVGNVRETPARDIWLSEAMRNIRRRVFFGDRNTQMCQLCDVHGTLHSRSSVTVLAKWYGWDALT